MIDILLDERGRFESLCNRVVRVAQQPVRAVAIGLSGCFGVRQCGLWSIWLGDSATGHAQLGRRRCLPCPPQATTAEVPPDTACTSTTDRAAPSSKANIGTRTSQSASL